MRALFVLYCGLRQPHTYRHHGEVKEALLTVNDEVQGHPRYGELVSTINTLSLNYPLRFLPENERAIDSALGVARDITKEMLDAAGCTCQDVMRSYFGLEQNTLILSAVPILTLYR